MATNFIVGRYIASAIAFASRKVILLSLGIGSHVLRRHKTSIVKHPELTTEINSEKENGLILRPGTNRLPDRLFS